MDFARKPIATKSRKFNQDNKKFIQEEVRKLISENVNEPLFLPWRARMLVARDGWHKPKIVIDCSETINILYAYSLPNINEQVSKIARSSLFSTLDLKSAYYQVSLCQPDRPFTAFETDGKRTRTHVYFLVLRTVYHVFKELLTI